MTDSTSSSPTPQPTNGGSIGSPIPDEALTNVGMFNRDLADELRTHLTTLKKISWELKKAAAAHAAQHPEEKET